MRLPSLKQILRKKLFFVGEYFHAALTGGAKTVFAAGRLDLLALFRHPGDRFRAQEIDGGLTFQEVHRRVETLHVFFQFPHELFRRFLLLGRADRVEPRLSRGFQFGTAASGRNNFLHFGDHRIFVHTHSTLSLPELQLPFLLYHDTFGTFPSSGNFAVHSYKNTTCGSELSVLSFYRSSL